MPEDSLPLVPTQVEVQIITQTPEVPRKEIERVENQLREYARRVNEGETEFSTLAMLYSQDGSARNGGELGYMNRTALAPEFANVAFSLTDPKKVSKIVKTEYGYHIIQLIGRQGDKVNVRHILLKPEVPQSEIDKALSRLDSIGNDIRAGKFSFDEGAAYISDDKDTRNNHGIMVNVDEEMGERTSRFKMQDLPQDVAKVVDTLKTGEISQPFTMIKNGGQEVCAIVKVKNRIERHRANMQEDFQLLKDRVLAKRREEKIEQWIKDKLKTTYVRMNPEIAECDLKYSGWQK